MKKSPLRSFANRLLRSSRSIAPESVRPWVQAMSGELDHIQSDFGALRWSVGCALVVFRRAALHHLREGFAMRKVELATITAVLLFAAAMLLSGTFREALRVGGRALTGKPPSLSDQEVSAIAERAKRDHDAEALAFAAMQTKDPAEADKLAREAIAQDPELTWVDYVLAGRQRTPLAKFGETAQPRVSRQIDTVEQWDPENAAVRLLAASQSQASPKELDSVLNSTELDSYFERHAELDRRVTRRLGLEPAFSIPLDIMTHPLPPPRTLMQATDLALSKCTPADTEECFRVTRFGETVMSQASNEYELSLGFSVARKGYEALLATNTLNKVDQEAVHNRLKVYKDHLWAAPSSLEWNTTRTLGILTDAGLALLILSGGIFLGSSILLAFGRRRTSLRVLLVASAGFAILSGILIRFAYTPFAAVSESLISGKYLRSYNSVSSFWAVSAAPWQMLFTGELDVAIWETVIVLLLGILVWRAAVHLRPMHAKPLS